MHVDYMALAPVDMKPLIDDFLSSRKYYWTAGITIHPLVIIYYAQECAAMCLVSVSF